MISEISLTHQKSSIVMVISRNILTSTIKGLNFNSVLLILGRITLRRGPNLKLFHHLSRTKIVYLERENITQSLQNLKKLISRELLIMHSALKTLVARLHACNNDSSAMVLLVHLISSSLV